MTPIQSEIAAIERKIRARQREMVRTAHRQPWLIGSPTSQRNAVAWARMRHSESIARERGMRNG